MKSSGNYSLTIMKPQGKMNYKAGHVIKHMFRSSHPKAFYRKGVLKIFAKFTGKHLCWNLFFRRLQHRCFPVNFVKFLRTSSFTEHFRWLLLTCYGIKPICHLNISLHLNLCLILNFLPSELTYGAIEIYCFYQHQDLLEALLTFVGILTTKPAFTYSKSTMETPGQFVKSVQSDS